MCTFGSLLKSYSQHDDMMLLHSRRVLPMIPQRRWGPFQRIRPFNAGLPAPTVRDIWPLLQKRFQQKRNSDGLLQLLPSSPTMDTTSSKRAAVLVLILRVDGRLSLVFTQRAAHLSQHAAQISFPGGHLDPEQDETLHDTAIREAKEELYDDTATIDSYWQTEELQILGGGTALPSIRGVPVYPIYAALLDQSFTSSQIQTMWSGNPSEVDTVFTVPICDLLDSETTQALPATRFNPPYPHAPVFPTEHGTIWGLTAYILRPTLHQLLGPVLCPARE